ncbi:MAG: hypothetical protein RSF40_01750 [Oscillospiraceae bacterium]
MNKTGNKKKGIFRNCRICMYYDTCTKYESCEYLSPTPSDENYIEDLMTELRAKVIPAPLHKLKVGRKDQNAYDDTITPLYDYHRQAINGALDEIRSGLTSHIYYVNDIAEILRFEPSINVTYSDKVYYVTL